MIEKRNLLHSFTVFLNKMQDLGIVKDFCLDTSENKEINLLELQTPFKKFVEEVNLIFNKVTSEPLENVTSEVVSMENVKEALKSTNEPENKRNVQLQVDKNEIQRRISAFLSRKRKEVEEWNVQEFCSRPYVDEQNPVWEQMDSCARVDAVFVPRFGSKSHVKVSRVENRWGPQTHLTGNPAKILKTELVEESSEQKTASIEAAQERIQLMESHLNLNADSSVRSSIFQRIKKLEDRILYLEGISPDYFTKAISNHASEKKRNIIEKEKAYSSWSVDDIQKRIQSLTESLKSKSQDKVF